MAKQATRIWIILLSLSMLVLSAACTDRSVSTGNTTPGQVEPQAVDGKSAGDTADEPASYMVDEIELLIMESFPIQVAAIVRGNLSDGCGRLDGMSATRAGNVFTIDIATHREGEMCTEALVPFEERVSLDVAGLKAGTYQVVAGDVSAEFTFDVDNQYVDDPSVDSTSPEYVQDVRGTVTRIAYGTDGMEVELTDGTSLYSVTISVIQAQVFGRMDQIQEGSELVVSGPTVVGIEPALVIAEKVTVLGSEPDYVLNLKGTVTALEPGTDGITLGIETPDGTLYTATISLVTTEIVYTGTEDEIQVGTPIWVSGELFELDGPHVKADTAVVQPVLTTGEVEVRPLPEGNEHESIVSGEVIVRGETGTVELPEGATVIVRLADISRQDVPSVLLSEQVYEDVTQLPAGYELPYDTGEIDERMVYAVSARVQDADGKLLYRSDTVHHALTRGAGESVTVELVAIQ